MRMENPEVLRKKYERYLIDDEDPITEYKIGAYVLITTNKRLLCIRKFPQSLTTISYEDISNVEYHTYIDWKKLINSIILLGVSSYGFIEFSLYSNITGRILFLLGDNIPEISEFTGQISPQTLTQGVIYVAFLTGIIYLIRFIMSLRGKLRIFVLDSAPIRINTTLSEDVKRFLKDIEDLRMKEPIPEEEGRREKTIEKKIEGVELENGHSYLIRELKPVLSLKLFINEVEKGKRGLYITRTNPKLIRITDEILESRFKSCLESGNIMIYWLTDSMSGEKTISPEPEQIFALISDFLERNREAIVLLDGLEYLITHSNFDHVLRFVQGVKDKIGTKNSILLLPVGEYTLSEKERALLEKEITMIF
ncbi:MAG: hypothetical protein DRO90_02950 [Candidatus Altiarchaeales archaeon]|nr:MAG: hypothetical protein DRO90_02950 [Candidatus Altiarchaeales archaeon]